MKVQKLYDDEQSREISLSKLENLLNNFSPVPVKEWQQLKPLMKYQKIKKDTFLLKDNEVCKQVYFFVKGGARIYLNNYLNDKNIETTCNFCLENSFVVDVSSFLNRQISSENIITLEDSEVLTISHDDFDPFLKKNNYWSGILNKLILKHLSQKKGREELLLIEDYEKRYRIYLEDNPHLPLRVEQQYIASYLGMTPETLSRIKKRIYSSQKMEELKKAK